MLSPDGFGEGIKAAPSIWSFDSGYGSLNTQEEEQSRNAPFYIQASTSSNSLGQRLDSTENLGLGLGFTNFHVGDQIRPKREEPAIEPLVTKLSVFTTRETSICDGDFFLPEFSSEGEGCLTCEFWRITNPGENGRCEDCRVPEIIEPWLLLADGCKGKEPVPSIEAPREEKENRLQGSTHTRCSACELSALIDPSGPSSCPSCRPSQGHLSPLSPQTSDYKVRRSRAGRNSKLPLSALNRLQAWLDAHQDNPYPSADEKKQLAKDCSITEKQVTTWFTNARARQLSPLDTWLTGSEDEGAKESDIASAAQTPAYTAGLTYLSENARQQSQTPYRRAGSVSGSSAFSAGAGKGKSHPQPSRRGKKKNYRRSNQPLQITELSPIEQQPTATTTTTSIASPNPEQEMWQCTFCHRHLVPKSWRRHEETQHRPRAQWTCMLFGPRLTFPSPQSSSRPNSSSNTTSYCAFCMAKDPSEDHFLEHHRISECAKRPIAERTFFRPDHLRQHVKNFHQATLFDSAQARWKRGPKEGGSGGGEGDAWVCGFCGEELKSWSVRETHIAGHFKEGKTMRDWKEWPGKEKGNEGAGKKDKKGKEKERKEDKEKEHHHGFARLSRTFTRRSTRSSKASTSQPQPQPQPQQYQQSDFSNTFAALPHTGPMSMPIDQTAYSAPPVLPDNMINMDPLMPMSNYGNFVDWSQIPMSEPQYTDNLFNPTLATTDFDLALNDALEFGNSVGYHGPWNPQN